MKTLRILTLGALLASTLAVTACNTVRGAGEDLERAGEAIQKSAK